MTTTKQSSSSTIRFTAENSFCTSFPLSENHLEKSECELISTIFPEEYLAFRGCTATYAAVHVPIRQPY